MKNSRSGNQTRRRSCQPPTALLFKTTPRSCRFFCLPILWRRGGEWNGQQIIPRAAVEDIRRGGDRDAFAKSNYVTKPGWSYRSMWWVSHNEHGAFAAMGIHGQVIYVDPKAEMVIARYASHPIAGNAGIDPTSLPAYHALGQHLLAHPQ